MLDVIRNSPNGDYVFRVFKKTNKLDDASRKIIIDAVIGWHLQHSIRITRSMFETLAIEIETQFNDNKASIYIF